MINLHMPTAEIFIPDGLPIELALSRTTHMAIAAHQDDIEIMAAEPILACFQQEEKWFTGVIVSDGRGSPRDGIYANYSDEDMRNVRFKEQKKAAFIGEYAAQVMLDYPSRIVKDGNDHQVSDDLVLLFKSCQPTFVYTHNLADKHDTHVGVALRVISAIRRLSEAERPKKLYGCEVWRDLDWMVDNDKVPFNLTRQENLQAALLGVFDSQISGGKRYDLASLGRRRAHATYDESHGVDITLGLAYAMDLSPLIQDAEKDAKLYIEEIINHFLDDVTVRINRLV
jgi:LmbE family N-acetylglucosaminyl deacetylase